MSKIFFRTSFATERKSDGKSKLLAISKPYNIEPFPGLKILSKIKVLLSLSNSTLK